MEIYHRNNYMHVSMFFDFVFTANEGILNERTL